MMRGSWLALLAAAPCAILGCSAQSASPGTQPAIAELDDSLARRSPLAGLEAGTPAEEVRNLLGEPALVEEKQEDGNAEVWYYDGGVVVMQKGKVAFSYSTAASQP